MAQSGFDGEITVRVRDMAPPARARIEAVDLLRGVIVAIMTLDHAHDFFGDLASSSTNLATTTPALFFTRWITHFLRPGVLPFDRDQCLSHAKAHLEAVVMRFALQLNFDHLVTFLSVLWGLGWAMIVLAGIIWLPRWASAAIGIAMIAGHNALDNIQPSAFGGFAPHWIELHSPGLVIATPRVSVFIVYVLIPWVGVTAMGYLLGQVYDWGAQHRRSLLFWLGSSLTAGFLILRFANVYGDPLPWSLQRSPLFTLLSFLNTNKYPPSLLFLLMTLGPSLLLLRVFDRGVPGWLKPPLIIGKVPLFFFVLHFYLIHLLAVGRKLCALWQSERDVPVAEPRPFPVFPAARLGSRPADGGS